MNVYERIKLEAEKKGVSISYLTEKAKLSAGTINKWTSNNVEEIGKGEPGANKLFKVAAELDCTMEYLLTGSKKYDTLNKTDIEWLDILKLTNQIPDKYDSECRYFIKKYIEAYIELKTQMD